MKVIVKGIELNLKDAGEKMKVSSRQILKNQLEQQAKMFVTEKDNTKLVVSVLATCTALLRVAEESMPIAFSQQEFNNVFAGYLGIANRIKRFYKNKMDFFNETASEMLKQILATLEETEKNKKDLEIKIADFRKKIEDSEKEVKSLELKLDDEKKKKSEVERKKLDSQRRLKELEETIAGLEAELININSKIDNLEPNIKVLINNVNTARDTYDEMLAYYSELQRIQEGIREEGYVDFESFSNRLQELNDSGKEIMGQYDSMLKNLTSDIEVLQAKIENRRKAGVLG